LPGSTTEGLFELKKKKPLLVLFAHNMLVNISVY